MFYYLSKAKRIQLLITLLCVSQMSTVWAISCSSGSCTTITEIETLHQKEIRNHYPKRIIALKRYRHERQKFKSKMDQEISGIFELKVFKKLAEKGLIKSLYNELDDNPTVDRMIWNVEEIWYKVRKVLFEIHDVHRISRDYEFLQDNKSSNISNPTLYAGSIDPSKHTKDSTDINRSITLLYQQSKQITKQLQKISDSISKDKSAIINQLQANKMNQAVHTMKKVLIDDQKHITQLSDKLINNLHKLHQLLTNNKTLIDEQSQKSIKLIIANNQQSANYLQYITFQIEHIKSYAKSLGLKTLSDFQYVGSDLRPLPYSEGWYSQFLGDFSSGEFSSNPMSTESYTVFLQKQVTPKVAHSLEYTHSINRSNTSNNSVFMRSASNELVLSTVLNTNSTDNLNLSVSYSNNKNDNYENTAFIGSRDGFTVGGSATYTKNIQDLLNQITISPYAILSYYYTNMNAFTADNTINVNDQSTQQMRLDLAMNLSKNYQLSKDWNVAPSLNLDYAYQSSHRGDLSYTYISSGEQQSSSGGQTGDNYLNSYLGINLIWKNKLITFLQVGIENDNEGYLKDLQTSIQYLF